jgi:glycosyltransferase involved in cell wall biosynthesis
MKTTLCILTKNELPCLKVTLPDVINACKKNKITDIFAIDGGSTDGTIEFFKKNSIKVLSQDNKGRGDAFHVAFKEIDTDLYIFYSPDGNEDINDVYKFSEQAQLGADIIIASRMMKGSFNEEDVNIIKMRKWANNAFNAMANITFRRNGSYITDSINGYRAITKSAVRSLSLDATDYTIEYQMTIRAFKKKLSISEFPTIEGKRLFGETQAKSIPTGLKFLKCYFREIFTRI